MIRSEAELRCLDEFAWEHDHCWACGCDDNRPRDDIDYFRHLEIHHIAKQGRRHERWNLARLCRLCHDLAEGHLIRYHGQRIPRLTAANVLWLKAHHDEKNYDRGSLQVVWRTLDLPESCPPADFMRRLYVINRRTGYPKRVGKHVR